MKRSEKIELLKKLAQGNLSKEEFLKSISCENEGVSRKIFIQSRKDNNLFKGTGGSFTREEIRNMNVPVLLIMHPDYPNPHDELG